MKNINFRAGSKNFNVRFFKNFLRLLRDGKQYYNSLFAHSLHFTGHHRMYNNRLNKTNIFIYLIRVKELL